MYTGSTWLQGRPMGSIFSTLIWTQRHTDPTSFWKFCTSTAIVKGLLKQCNRPVPRNLEGSLLGCLFRSGPEMSFRISAPFGFLHSSDFCIFRISASFGSLQLLDFCTGQTLEAHTASVCALKVFSNSKAAFESKFYFEPNRGAGGGSPLEAIS